VWQLVAEGLNHDTGATVERLILNGINGETGEYLFPPTTMEELARAIHGDSSEVNEKAALKSRTKRTRGLKGDGDPSDLTQTGWAIVFAQTDPDAEKKREALSDLIALRQTQCGQNVRVLLGDDGYRDGETKRAFLGRVGAEVSGPADPDKFPYYVLLVGPPTAIPFKFQYLLDIQYAVGRVHFDDIEDYRSYASSVVRAEEGEAKRSPAIGFFGPANADDVATQRSLHELIRPLADRLGKKGQIERRFGPQATKEELGAMLLGSSRPALLFTASHGVGFASGHPDQPGDQGALVCQDWPGPKSRTGQMKEHYFSGADFDNLAADADIHGMISFHFACYGAGTPHQDEFVSVDWRASVPGPAPQPMLARLPERLLLRPGGGALAVIGHIERQWTHAFSWEIGSPGRGHQAAQLGYLESTLQKLMAGHRVGAAMESVNQRYAEVATEWAEEEEEARAMKAEGSEMDRSALNALWIAKNDARNYIVVGDPAVRIPLE
jgi:hypothetical protein